MIDKNHDLFRLVLNHFKILMDRKIWLEKGKDVLYASEAAGKS